MDIILRIWRLMASHRWWLVGAYATTLGALAATLVLPWFLGVAVDRAVEMFQADQVSTGALLWLGLLLAGLTVLQGLLHFGQTYTGEALSQYVAYDLRDRFYDRVQRLSFEFRDRHHTGNLMSRAISDVESVRVFVAFGLLRTPYFALLFFTSSGILLWLDWRLGLMVIGFIPLLLLYSIRTRSEMRSIWQRISERMGELSTVLQENLTGVRVVKAFAAERHEERKFDEKNVQVAEESVRATRVRASSTAVMVMVFMLAMALILGYGGSRVINGEMTLGDLTRFLLYSQALVFPVRMIGWLVSMFARAVASGQRLFEVLDAESAVRDAPDAAEMPRAKGHVRFEDVHFSYAERQPALQGISFEARPGQVVALLGAPGSGKSTVVNLLPRFYDVTSGRVTIDGRDIREVAVESLRRNVGIVQQDVFLFSASLRDNIAYGRPDAAMAEVESAARTAQLHELVASLKDGYNTEIGERGVNLSGGQRQRVAIARTLLLDPPILVLDDSTSSVDAGTEALFRQAMESLMKGRTTFVIAHRLSSVRRADLVLVLMDGRIAERGTHEELLARGGLYRQIYELQLLPQERTDERRWTPAAAGQGAAR